MDYTRAEYNRRYHAWLNLEHMKRTPHMDPTANLLEQEALIIGMRDTRQHAYDLERLTDLRCALSTWLACEGFEPDWSLAPVATLFYTKGRIAQ